MSIVFFLHLTYLLRMCEENLLGFDEIFSSGTEAHSVQRSFDGTKWDLQTMRPQRRHLNALTPVLETSILTLHSLQFGINHPDLSKLSVSQWNRL